MVSLTVTIGAPGSGKTTWCQTHARNALLCSTDPLRTDAAARRAAVSFLARLGGKAERALAKGRDVATDGCNVRGIERARWLGIARRCGATAHLVVLHAPLPGLVLVQRGRTPAITALRLSAYVQDFDRALPRIEGEGWSMITHVHREWTNDPEPLSYSRW